MTYPKSHFPRRPGARRKAKPESNVRFPLPEQYALVKQAAAHRRLSINQFMVEAALTAATKALGQSAHDQAA